jgi:CRP-like cAMP-binding protein
MLSSKMDGSLEPLLRNEHSLRPVQHYRSARNRILMSAPDSLERLLPQLDLVTLRSGQQIFEVGQRIEFIYFPETAVVTQLCYLEDGSSAATSIIGYDGLVGMTALLSGSRARYWSVVSIGGTAHCIRADKVRSEFTSNDVLQRAVLKYLADRLGQLIQRTACTARHQLEQRLCTWLLMILDRANSAELPLTHEAIADHLGVRRAGVTSVCNTLRSHGVIAYQQALMTINDRNALERLACECYRRCKLLPVPLSVQSSFGLTAINRSQEKSKVLDPTNQLPG